MKDQRAKLTIIQEGETSLAIEFSWPGLVESIVRDTIPILPNWGAKTFFRFSKLLDQLVFVHISKKQVRTKDFSSIFKNIGMSIWTDLFKKSDPISNALLQFDAKARGDGLLASNSQLILSIETDISFIPWELFLIPNNNNENDPSWDPEWFEKPICMRYNVLRVFHSCVTQNISEKTGERNRVLLLLGLPTPEERPSLSDDEEKAIQPIEGYTEVWKKLMRVITHLTSKGTHIDYEFSESVAENKIRGWADKDKYDLILFIGAFKEKEGVENLGRMVLSSDKEPYELDVAYIESGNHHEPIIFLDGCKTDSVEYKGVSQDIDAKKSAAYKVLEKGACAFIGTIQNIEPIVAARFATVFLNSVFISGMPLSKAMFEARLNSYRYFEEERHKISCLFFNLQTSKGYEETLINSFRYGYERKSLTLIYPKVVDHYFEGFRKDIYPSNAPIVLKPKPTFSAVVNYMLGEDNLVKTEYKLTTPYIADIPILSAAKLIEENRDDEEKRLAILGGLFRLNRELSDGFLYYRNDTIDRALFYHPYYLATVTTLALNYFVSIKHADRLSRKGIRRTSSYETVLDFALGCIKTDDYEKFDAFILAGPYETIFNEALLKKFRKTEDQDEKQVFIGKDVYTKKEINIVRIDLSKYLFRILKDQEDFYLINDLPASVLVARYADIINNQYIYQDVLIKWKKWRSGILQSNQELLDKQDVIVDWTSGDQRSVIDFSKFTEAALGKYLQLSSLREDDFFEIASDNNIISHEIKNEKEHALQWVSNKIKKAISELKTKQVKMGKEARALLSVPGNEKLSDKINDDATQIDEIIAQYVKFKAKFINRIGLAQTLLQINQAMKELNDEIPELDIDKGVENA